MKLLHICLFAVILSTLTACAPGHRPIITEPGASVDQIEEAAKILYKKGKYLESAMEYSKLATAAEADKKAAYQLKVVGAFVSGNYLPQAKQLLNELNIPATNSIQTIEKQLLLAQTYLADQQSNEALNHLAAINDIQLGKPAQQQRFYLIAAKTQQALGQHLKAANGYIALTTYLSTETELDKNRNNIWNNLQQLNKKQLRKLVAETSSQTHAGWYALALLGKTGLTQQRAIKQQVRDWSKQYPSHLNEKLAATLLSKKTDLQLHPKKIALLLPLSNKLAAAGKAVRDGFLAAYYKQNNNADITIQIYDSGQADMSIEGIYHQAIEDGAEFVVGPLDKSQVTRLIEDGDIDVPSLALNYADTGSSAKQLFQFGLSPEHEARQIAERAWMNGHRYALALVPEGAWGERIYQAFRSRFEEFGGMIDEYQSYPPQDHDFSKPIKTLLNIDESNSRKRALSRATQTRFTFSPRRRQDVDFIFMAAFPRQAHQIPPQLQFHHAADIPIYTTSHAFSGHSNPKKDRDLNGIIIGDSPWVLSSSPLRKQIKALFPDGEKRYTRLYALGIDAFNLIPHIQRLETDITETYSGVTGYLRIYENRQIYRQLTWAVFSRGKPVNQGM